MTPARRSYDRHAFDAHLADTAGSEEIPRWIILLGGAFIAAILGSLLGGAMHV